MILGWVFFGNVFLLNYLVAILTIVYEQMKVVGDFHYKCNRYQFIERYAIAMLDEHGYSELVIHPPPLNIFTVLLIPCIVKKDLMKKASVLFSKFIFWLENIVYIIAFIIYEVALVPIIFVRIIYNIIRLAELFNMI